MKNRFCPDCGVDVGEIHNPGCDMETCPECGGQYLGCECRSKLQRLIWTGESRGKLECREFGWYSKMVKGSGWVSCDKNDVGASENLNRLHKDAIWSKDYGRFILQDTDLSKLTKVVKLKHVPVEYQNIDDFSKELIEELEIFVSEYKKKHVTNPQRYKLEYPLISENTWFHVFYRFTLEGEL